jgi:histidinol-phosphatase (PHP family)
LKGLEADFFPETIDQLRELTAAHKLDYIIGSVHFVDRFPIDENSENWDSLDENDRNDVIRCYWSRVAGMAKTGFFSFAGHLDLYKKFGHRPTVDISTDIAHALDAIAEAEMAVEISTAGLHKRAEEIYPSADILRECRRRKIPVLITADAHRADDLTRDYDKAKELMKIVGYDSAKLWRPQNCV